MAKKYTSGPWEFDMDRNTHDCVIYKKGTTENSYGYIDEGGVVGSSEWIWISEADARLIACAPELLEMLENMTATFRSIYGDGEPLVSSASELIAKAKGE